MVTLVPPKIQFKVATLGPVLTNEMIVAPPEPQLMPMARKGSGLGGSFTAPSTASMEILKTCVAQVTEPLGAIEEIALESPQVPVTRCW